MSGPPAGFTALVGGDRRYPGPTAAQLARRARTAALVAAGRERVTPYLPGKGGHPVAIVTGQTQGSDLDIQPHQVDHRGALLEFRVRPDGVGDRVLVGSLILSRYELALLATVASDTLRAVNELVEQKRTEDEQRAALDWRASVESAQDEQRDSDEEAANQELRDHPEQ